MLTLGDPTAITGEQCRKATEYDLGDMVRRGTYNAPPAAAICPAYWGEAEVGRVERVDWMVVDGSEEPFSTYWFVSSSGKTQVAARELPLVLQRVTELLTGAA